MKKRAVVCGDTHFPLHDQSAINCVLKAIKIVQPNVFIHLGDVGEWESCSSWKYKKIKRPPLEYILPEIEKETLFELINQFPQTISTPETRFDVDEIRKFEIIQEIKERLKNNKEEIKRKRRWRYLNIEKPRNDPAMWRRNAKKKAERQGVGTLEPFLK